MMFRRTGKRLFAVSQKALLHCTASLIFPDFVVFVKISVCLGFTSSLKISWVTAVNCSAAASVRYLQLKVVNRLTCLKRCLKLDSTTWNIRDAIKDVLKNLRYLQSYQKLLLITLSSLLVKRKWETTFNPSQWYFIYLNMKLWTFFTKTINSSRNFGYFEQNIFYC